MTHEEYEQRKRRLEEELQAGVELLQAAYRQQVRALEVVWRTMGAEVALPGPREAQAAEAPQERQAAPAKARRRGMWELREDIDAALGRLPEVFDHNDVRRELGYEPNRTSLYRTLQDLQDEGILTIARVGSGKVPTRYRQAGGQARRAEA